MCANGEKRMKPAAYPVQERSGVAAEAVQGQHKGSYSAGKDCKRDHAGSTTGSITQERTYRHTERTHMKSIQAESLYRRECMHSHTERATRNGYTGGNAEKGPCSRTI